MTLTEDQARECFSNAFDEHYRAILTYCRRRTFNMEDAADAASTTFMTAWRRVDQLYAADIPLAWLYGVARGTLANLRRGDKRLTALVAKAENLAPLSEPDAADAAIDAVELDRAERALASLSDTDQELIRLAAYEQLSHEDIAIVLQIETKQVRSRLYRARERLKESFGSADENAT